MQSRNRDPSEYSGDTSSQGSARLGLDPRPGSDGTLGVRLSTKAKAPSNASN